MQKESYIKFECKHIAKEISYPDDINKLISIGNRLKKAGLIGKIDDETGFGNISCRDKNNGNIYISASKSGIPDTYKKENFCRIVSWDAEKNFVESEGLMPASSETLSHLAVFESLKSVNCVVHIHSAQFWNIYLNNELTSNIEIEYGTKEMYFEIVRLLKGSKNNQMLVMGGHEDGLLLWADDWFLLEKTISTMLLPI